MAKNYNLTIIEGHLTKDPVVNRGSVRFTLGCNRGSKSDGSDAGADFISCVAFATCAEYLTVHINAGYLKKGTHIIVIGTIQTGSYEKDGTKIYTTDVCVNRYNLILDAPISKENGDQQTAPGTSPQGNMPQGFPPQQSQQQTPSQGFPPQQSQQQTAPQGFPPQGFPPQQSQQQTPPQGFPPQQSQQQTPPQGFPPQQSQQQTPPQGFPGGMKLPWS
jgi:single-strand DNA-binding protein